TTDPVPANNTATDVDTLISADLAAGVSGPSTARTGTAFTYTITVTNTGPSPASGVTLTHTLPAGAAVDSIVPSAGLSVGRAGPTLTGTIASLAAGASAEIVVTVRSTAPGTATLTAAATGTTYDPNPANNTATAGVTVAAGPPLVGVPQLAVGADAGGSPVVTVYNPDGTVASTLTPFPGFTGGVRTAVGDFNGDGIPDIAVGTGPGMPAEVKVLDGKTGAVLFDRQPFGTFTGGVFVAAGDITGSGRADLVVTPDEGGGPRVEIVEGGDFKEIADFFGIDDPNFRGGARVALGDLNGDGKADLVVSAGFGGGPRVSVYDGAALLQGQFVHLVPDFFAFEQALRNGVYVAVGDVNGDGVDDVVLGAGPGGGPRVLALSGRRLLAQGFGAAIGTPIANFFGGNPGNRGGIRVAVKNLDGDRYADVVTGSGAGGGSQVAAYPGMDLAAGSALESRSFDAFPGFSGGVFVG
ncbi:MAG: repeat protein, partial [Gemmataceae bacterium]|nr:repeat protein [Gemmataceae bacterium]